MKGALDVHRELLARDIPHEIVRLPYIVLAADELPRSLGLPAQLCLAVRLFELDRGFAAVLTTVGSSADPAALSRATGSSRVHPAGPATVNAVTDFAAGLVAPLPLPAEVALIADARCGTAPVVYTPTGDAGTALGIRSADLLQVTGALVDDLLTGPLRAVPGQDRIVAG